MRKRYRQVRLRHSFIVCFVLLLSYPSVAGDPPGGGKADADPAYGETLPLAFPLQFTRNDGQWDARVRYRTLHMENVAELRADGITFHLDGTRPHAIPHAETGQTGPPVASLRFVSPSAAMVIEAGNMTATQSHFYPGNVPEGGIEEVPSFRDVTYRNVWEHIDVRYSAVGDRIRQEITLRPGANLRDVRFSCDGGMGEDLVRAGLQQYSGGPAGEVRYHLQGSVASLTYTPGVLRDTVVLRTEFSTFFIGRTRDETSSVSTRVFPDGRIVLHGHGIPPLTTGSNYLCPSDSMKHWGGYPSFLAGFDCGGTSLHFATYFGREVGGGGGQGRQTYLQPDDSTGFFMLFQFGYAFKTSDSPPRILTNLDFTTTANSIDYIDHTNGYSYLARISLSGKLDVGTYIAGVTLRSVCRTPDRGVLLAGNARPYFSALDNFHHYTTAPTHLYPGMLVKLNEPCDSVLLGVRLDVLEDSVWLTSAAQHADGSITIVGTTFTNPLTRNAWQAQRSGIADIYLARMNAEADSVLWATMLGGDGYEYVHSGSTDELGGEFATDAPWDSHSNDILAVDGDGGIWIAGLTRSMQLLEMPERRLRNSNSELDVLLAHFDRYGQPTMIRGIGGDDGLQHQTALGVEVLPCGSAMLMVSTMTGNFPQLNAQPLLPGRAPFQRNGSNALVVYEADGTLRFSSYWGEFPASSQRYDPTGHVVSAPGWGYGHWPERLSMRTYNAYQPLPAHSSWNAVLARHYLPLCGEDAITCSFTLPDTIRVDSARKYVSVEYFPLDVTISNPDPTRAVFDLQCELRLPPGIVTVPDTEPWLRDVAPMLAPGASVETHWRLRVLPGAVVDSVLPIVVTTHYRWADHLDNCLYSHGGCRAEIAYLRHDSKPTALLCDLLVRDSVRIDSKGEQYDMRTLPVTLVLRNLGEEAVLPGEAALRVGSRGVRITPAGDSLRALHRLQPLEEQTVSWQLELDRWGIDRDIGIQAVVRDVMGRLPANCLAEIYVPGIIPLRCTLTAPAQMVEAAGTGFSAFPLGLQLENRIDTLLRRVEAEVDLARAPRLRLGSGEEAGRYLGPLAAGVTRTTQWRLAVASPPKDSSEQIITVWYWYQEDTTRRSCEIAMRLVPLRDAARCTLAGPMAISVADSLLTPSPFEMTYRLENSGTRTLEVDRHELLLPSGAGVRLLDAATQSGGTLLPGGEQTRSWRLRPLVWHDTRTVRLQAIARTITDSVLSVCEHEVTIPGVDGLRCAIDATDTLRFARNPARYEPSPLPVRLELRNVLDERQWNIDAQLDLTSAPRLILDPSESTGKTLASIDSHATGALTWLLIPQPSPIAQSQEVVIRYRSDEQTEWKECRTTVFIEAWPEEIGIACSTGGHDSLYADSHFERFIPDPLHVSYTATNTGTVSLTGCEATIILPPEFMLAGTDSTQTFTAPEYGNQSGGPVPEGTLLPGATCTRWWQVSPMNALTTLDPQHISWQWTSNEQGSAAGCSAMIVISPDDPGGIALTPLHLLFEAERGGTLPTEQQVQLWTGGGLAMPWTAQPGDWWLGAQPLSGSSTAHIVVQPVSTQLDVGAHVSAITFAATPANRSVVVTYVIRKNTGVGNVPVPGAITLEAWPQPVSARGRLHVRVASRADDERISLIDVLGRERISLNPDGSGSVTIDLAPLQLSPGMYILRMTSRTGMLQRRIVIAR